MIAIEDIEQLIRAKVHVDRSQVVVAKNFIVNHVRSGTATSGMMGIAINEFLKTLSALQPSNVIISAEIPLDPQLDMVAVSIGWKLAFVEAVWDLVHSGTLLVRDNETINPSVNQSYTISVPSANARTGTWQFSGLQPGFPRHVMFARSRVNNQDAILADGDLYLQFLSIPNLHLAVVDFLRQAILCFRHELYLPAVAMLGSASESIWLTVGELLIAYCDSLTTPPTINSTIRTTLTNPLQGIALKIAAIIDLYQQHQSTSLASIVSSSGVKIDSLRAASSWAHNVRTARNALHPAGGAGIPATYETVSMFLLATSQHLGTLYRLYDALNAALTP